MPVVGDKVNKTISSFILIDDIKVECEGNLNYPFEKFVVFIISYSDFHRLIRSLCYVFRLVKDNLMEDNKEKKKFLQLLVLPLIAQERSEAECYVIKLVQRDYFGKLYD